MRVIWIALFSSIMLASCANADDGFEYSYWDNGNIKTKMSKVNDTLDGENFWYYENGKPQMSVTYSMGVKNGKSCRWYENGQPEAVYFYNDDVFDSIYEAFDTDGHLVSRAFYKEGRLNGTFQQWYGDGKKYVDGEYLDDMMHGSWIMFYHNGAVASNAVFDRGTGIQKGYSDDGGRLMTLIHYKNNKKNGEELHYSPDGKIVETLLWEDGEYVGKK